MGGETKRLELRYHPDNPYNKAICGEANERQGLLFSVKVRRSKRNPKKAPQYVVTILGYITKSITFECKYKYVGVRVLVIG